MKRLADDAILKQQLLSRYLFPGLGLEYGPTHPFTIDFARACSRYEVIKYEHFELSGPDLSGKAFLFEHALAHSYFHYTDTGAEQGIWIYRPHELIFQGDSLLYREDRLASLQALEPGGLLALSYTDLRQLMDKHLLLKQAIETSARRQVRALNNLSRFLGMPAEQRFKQFRAHYRSILHRLPQRVQALHINISRSQFNNLLKNFGS